VPCYGTQACPPKDGFGRRAWQSQSEIPSLRSE
jgi:hypothetical protein